MSTPPTRGPRKRLFLDLFFLLLCAGGLIFALTAGDHLGALVSLLWIAIYGANSWSSLVAVKAGTRLSN